MTGARSLHFVSPLPPVRSGIADYSADILPYLRERYAISLAPDAAPPGALPLYQVGNNVHHADIYAMAVEEPGIVVLHDYVLHHLLGEITLREGDEASYLATLAYGHGQLGAEAARARLLGIFGQYQHFVLPANAWLLDRSLAVIVHNHHAQRRIAEAHPDLPVHHVPMGIPDVAEVGVEEEMLAARRELGIAPDAFVIANLGFVTPIKRLDSVLRAFARLLATEPRALLCVVGEVSPSVDLAGLCARLQISSRVRIPGYVPFAAWHSYLRAADVCVNLRFPSAGETSASLLRIMGYGKPVLVSRYAQFRELPEGAAAHVDLGAAEEPVLARFLVELSRDPGLRQTMGDAARRFVREEHSMQRAAAAYGEALDATLEMREELRRRVEGRGARQSDWVRTTRVPGVLHADVRSRAPELSLAAGGSRLLRVWVHNLGDTVWLRNSGRGERAGFVIVDARFLRADGSLAAEAWGDLPADVRPGASFHASVELAAPAAPGRYTLDVDLRQMGLGRFADRGPGESLRIPVVVGL